MRKITVAIMIAGVLSATFIPNYRAEAALDLGGKAFVAEKEETQVFDYDSSLELKDVQELLDYRKPEPEPVKTAEIEKKVEPKKTTQKTVVKTASVSKQGKLTTMTAYSSDVSQTDSSPTITASGQHVRWGIVAANHLPMGTKIKIPALFGDQVFVVADRMHPKNYGKVDVWFPSRAQAVNFGRRTASVVVL